MLKSAATVWRDQDRYWLNAVPVIRLEEGKKRKPYPVTWEEQRVLFQALPPHLQRMALYKVNTGCREREVVQLRWDWEVQVPELCTSVSILPEHITKNAEERVIVLNGIARRVVDEQTGRHPERVFTYKGSPVTKIYNTGWKRARKAAAAALDREALVSVRVHDLRHTFSHRLRCCGVGLEDRKALLGHKSGDITTHYSAPEVRHLIECVERLCEERPDTVLRLAVPTKVSTIVGNLREGPRKEIVTK